MEQQLFVEKYALAREECHEEKYVSPSQRCHPLPSSSRSTLMLLISSLRRLSATGAAYCPASGEDSGHTVRVTCHSVPHCWPWPRRNWPSVDSLSRTTRRLRGGPAKRMLIPASARTRCGSELQPEEWAARACFASASLPALFLPSFPCTMISSHPELSLLASVDALSNSLLPHNPPRSVRQY
jgi:hypothetical protein